MTAEFTCCECGTHVRVLSGHWPMEPPLCLFCVFLPGWTNDSAMRESIEEYRAAAAEAKRGSACGSD